jgi:hypothetical protein
MNTQSLPVRLTTDELLMRSDELAKSVRERDDAERAMKSAQATAKRKIDLLDLDITRLADVVRERQENRPVEVTEFKNWRRLTMDTVRIDTGELVGSRSMSSYERNEALPFAADDAPRKAEEPEPSPEEPAPEPEHVPEEPSSEPDPDPAAPAVIPAEEPVPAEPAVAAEPAEKLAN